MNEKGTPNPERWEEGRRKAEKRKGKENKITRRIAKERQKRTIGTDRDRKKVRENRSGTMERERRSKRTGARKVKREKRKSE